MENSATRSTASTSAARVPGLDAIRFMMAFWVMLSHFRIPVPDAPTGALAMWARFAAHAVSGSSAVMVFFVISGFCIHYPYREHAPDLLPYYARRHIRILVPMLAALGLAAALGVGLRDMASGVLWSLLCEEIYYTIYPLLRRMRQHVGWLAMVGGGLALTIGIPLLLGKTPKYRPGLLITWALLLPVWMAGCWLAEHIDRVMIVPSRATIWAARIGMWGCSVAAPWLYAHTPIGFGYTMKLIAIPIVGWLALEIRAAGVRPLRIERWGIISYSLYLVHVPLQVAMQRFYGAPLWQTPVVWLGAIAAAMLVAVAFSAAIERPAHQFARQFAARVAEVQARRRILPEAA